jgi:hypothetical protein
MRNRHVTRFGNPTTHLGALYFVTDREGLLQMAVDLQCFSLIWNGEFPSIEYLARLKERIRTEQSIYDNLVKRLGIPADLKSLLQATKKAEVTKLGKEMLISEYDLFLLIHNSKQLNFTHRAKFKDFISDQSKITDEDENELRKGNVIPMTKSLS